MNLKKEFFRCILQVVRNVVLWKHISILIFRNIFYYVFSRFWRHSL